MYKSGFIWVWLLIIQTITLYAQTNYTYSYIPKQVYQNQLFCISIMSDDGDSKNIPDFEFDSWNDIQPISKKPLVIKNSSNTFYTFCFKAKTKDITIPRIFISTEQQKTMLNPHFIKVKALKAPKNFSNIIATEFKVINSQISNLDKNSYMVTLSIEAIEANIDDIYIPNVTEYGFDRLDKSYAKSKAVLYIIVSNKQKYIEFSYFNSIKKQFENIKIKLHVEDSSVTTQSDLNPQYDSFDLLKKYLFMLMVAFFFIMFTIKRDFFYLTLGVVSLITLLTFYIPHKKICIKEGSSLYILPTRTSRVSTTITEKYSTDILGEHNHYKKIQYKNHIVGWIKDEDVCKD